jgi:hypothetical protein
VSEPSAIGTHRAATAAADPPLDPPGMRSSAHGLCTGPNAEFSFDDPIANSSQFVLPTITAPAASRRRTTVASYGGMKSSRIRDDAVVNIPRTLMLSLIAIGIPASGPSDSLALRRSSICCARAMARSASTRLNALRVRFTDAMRSRAARHDSTAETRPAAMSFRKVAAGMSSTFIRR